MSGRKRMVVWGIIHETFIEIMKTTNIPDTSFGVYTSIENIFCDNKIRKYMIAFDIMI